ncbi:hypothetical protein [Clostridium uliginosum]|uniref:Uncharacterized protein n=1 Tax=Clostridium uliginosum TaxID=119641 RepID=A0A1I1GPS8_9CLOT|nr:hypothetical protein [Clostridium uliginosum]SFC13465.1 hypothetical protein SAMN05421842_10114 [Clostridium uliginosum]
MAQNSNYKNNYYRYNKSNNEHTSDRNDGINFTEEDIEKLRLLDIQRRAQIISIYASILSYMSTIEGIELIYSKYTNNSNSNNVPNPDIPALQSVYLGLITRSIFTEIGVNKYNMLYEKYINGKITYSLKPNIDINIGNMLGIISSYYTLRGTKGIYDRDINQPIFGI